MKSLKILGMTLLLAVLCAASASAQEAAEPSVPSMINYQGRLADSSGKPLHGNYTLRFALYDHPVTGEVLWQESQNVVVADGKFNVLLGSVDPITSPVFRSPETYLGLRVNNDTEMTPRSRIASVGYAFKAQDAATVNGLRANEISAGGTVEGFVDFLKVPNSQTQTVCRTVGVLPEGARFEVTFVRVSANVTGLVFHGFPEGSGWSSNNIIADTLGEDAKGLVLPGGQEICWKATTTGSGEARITLSGEIKY